MLSKFYSWSRDQMPPQNERTNELDDHQDLEKPTLYDSMMLK